MKTLYGASKAERIAARAIYIPKNAKLVPGPAGGAVYIYQYQGKLRECFAAMLFWGSSAKPTEHIAYRSEQQRAEAIAQWHANIKGHAERKATTAASKAAWVNPAKVGDILYTSWGYDQTNVDFYAVTKVSGKRVWVRPIAQEFEGTGFMSGRCWPKMPIELHGEETMHTARQCESSYAIKINESATAWLESGRTHYSSSYA